jgi:hypothetical protein
MQNQNVYLCVTVSAHKYMLVWRICVCMYKLEYMYQCIRTVSFQAKKKVFPSFRFEAKITLFSLLKRSEKLEAKRSEKIEPMINCYPKNLFHRLKKTGITFIFGVG